MLSKPHYCSHVILPEKTEWKKERQQQQQKEIEFFFKNPFNVTLILLPKVVALYFSIKGGVRQTNCIENQYRVTLSAARLSKQHFVLRKVSKCPAIEHEIRNAHENLGM